MGVKKIPQRNRAITFDKKRCGILCLKGMDHLTRLYASLLRIILLLVGVMIALYIGSSGYQSVNAFLSSNNLPCLEVISSLVVIVPVVTLFYGQHVRRYFWQRMRRFNAYILLGSLLVGLLFTILPHDLISPSITNCQARLDWNSKITYGLGTAVLTALLAFIGFDLGVTLKHISLKLHHHHGHQKSSKKRTAATKKKKRK